MANTQATSVFPLSLDQPPSSPNVTPMAQTNEQNKYKDLLSADVAAEDVGLFYQLNGEAGDSTNSSNRSVNQYPLEANSRYV